MKVRKFIIGLVSGLTIGVVISTLFAPQEGRKTRESIVDKMKSVRLSMPFKKNIDDVHIK